MKNLPTYEEFLNENYSLNERKSMTAKKYDKLSDDEREKALLSVVDDSDIDQYWDMKFNELPDELSSNMYESFNEPGFSPHKLKNSRLVMKTRDELYYMQSHQLEKLLDQVNKIKNKLQDKYNKEQDGHGRFNIMDSLSADLTYLRSYAKIINYFIN